MRIAVGMLMCLGGLSAAWATDPPAANPAAGPQPTARDQGKPDPAAPVTGASAPSASKSENAPTPVSAPASAAAQPSKTTELTADEKNYLSHGFKLQIRGGQKYFCRSEAKLGTRFATTTCRTAEQMATAARNSKDFASEMERPNGNRVGH